MDSEKKVFAKLFVSDKDVMEQLENAVERASVIFNIESPSGRILFKNFGALSDERRVAALLLGKYFAVKGGLDGLTEELSISEIAKELGRPMTTLSPNVTQLVSKGFIERLPTRTYRVSYHRIQEILDFILSSEKKK